MAIELGHRAGLRWAFWVPPLTAFHSHGPKLQCSVREDSKSEFTEYTQVIGSNLYI